MGGRRDLCCAPRGLFSAFLFFLLELLGGNGWLRSLWNGARLWSKKVNLLVVCFAGYECFSAVAFYGSQSVALKGEEIYVGCSDFWGLSDIVFFFFGFFCAHIEVRALIDVQFIFNVRLNPVSQSSLLCHRVVHLT